MPVIRAAPFEVRKGHSHRGLSPGALGDVRARDLAEDYPLVQLTDDASTAVELMAKCQRPGVVVVDANNRPVTVLPGSQVLRFVVPRYVQDDLALARVYDERGADACGTRLRGRTVAELLSTENKRCELPQVSGTATVIECAAVMAKLHCSLVVVRDGDQLVGLAPAGTAAVMTSVRIALRIRFAALRV